MNIKQLKELVESGIECLIKVETAQDDLDAVAEAMESKLDMSKAEAKAIIKSAYDKQYNEDKYLTKKEKVEKLYSAVEALE